MANYILKDAYIYLNSCDVSGDTNSVSFSVSTAVVDNTHMGDDDIEFLPGLKGGDTITLSISAENTDAGTSEDLWDVHDGNAAVALVLASQGSSISATNPSFSMSVIMTSLGLIEGSVGDKAIHNVTLQLTGAVTRAEA